MRNEMLLARTLVLAFVMLLAFVYHCNPAAMRASLKMKDVEAIQLFEAAKPRWVGIPVIMLSAFATLDSAVESLRKHAFDFVSQSVKLDEFESSVRRAARKTHRRNRCRLS